MTTFNADMMDSMMEYSRKSPVRSVRDALAAVCNAIEVTSEIPAKDACYGAVRTEALNHLHMVAGRLGRCTLRVSELPDA